MKVMIATATALLLAVGAASAATPDSQTQPNSPSATAQPAPKMSAQKLKENLAKAGLTDIKVAPESFVVHAKDQNGNSVMMLVTPSSFMEETNVTMKDDSAANPTTAASSDSSFPKTGATAASQKP
jgi:hypothetical protein